MPEHRVVLWDKIGPGKHPCHWCGVEVEWSTRRTAEGCLTTDHVDGDTRNNAPENLVPACHSCNVTRARDHRFEDGLFLVVGGVRQKAVRRTCQRCGKDFLFLKKFEGTKGKGRFCSRACMYA